MDAFTYGLKPVPFRIFLLGRSFFGDPFQRQVLIVLVALAPGLGVRPVTAMLRLVRPALVGIGERVTGRI
jgi:hypothetical protein